MNLVIRLSWNNSDRTISSSDVIMTANQALLIQSLTRRASNSFVLSAIYFLIFLAVCTMYMYIILCPLPSYSKLDRPRGETIHFTYLHIEIGISAFARVKHYWWKLDSVCTVWETCFCYRFSFVGGRKRERKKKEREKGERKRQA